MMDNESAEDGIRRIGKLMQHHLDEALLGDFRMPGAESTISSLAAMPPRLTKKSLQDIAGKLRRMAQDAKERDPFRDIPQDHVIVVHPRHQHDLEKLTPPIGALYGGQLHRYGREVIFEHRAPQDKFEIMGLLTYYTKYPPIKPRKMPADFGNQDGDTTVCGVCVNLDNDRCGLFPDVELVNDEPSIFGCGSFNER